MSCPTAFEYKFICVLVPTITIATLIYAYIDWPAHGGYAFFPFSAMALPLILGFVAAHLERWRAARLGRTSGRSAAVRKQDALR